MAPIGYKIKHKTLRSCVALVPDPRKPQPFNPAYGVEGKCPTCLTPHQFKTWHLDLVDDGTCIVSKSIFDKLCEVGAIDGVPGADRGKIGAKVIPMLRVPFVFVGEVEPPPLNIGMGRGTVTDGEGRTLRVQRPIVIHVDREQRKR